MVQQIIRNVAGVAVASLLLAGCSTAEDLGSSDAGTANDTATSTSTSTGTDPQPTETAPAGDSKPEQADLVVNDNMFWRDSDGDWNYFVTIDNPNTDYLWDFEEFSVELLDSEGTILESDNTYGNLLPGETYAMAGRFYDSADLQADSLNVRGATDGTYMPDVEFGSFTLSTPEYKNDTYSTKVSGTVESSFVEDQELVEIIGVVLDANGKPRAQDFTYVDRLPSGGKARYELSFYDLTITDSDVIKVYALV